MKAGKGSEGAGFIYQIKFCPALHCCKTPIHQQLQNRDGRNEKGERGLSPRPLPSPPPVAASGLPSFVILVTTSVPGDREALGECGGAQEMTAGGWGRG